MSSHTKTARAARTRLGRCAAVAVVAATIGAGATTAPTPVSAAPRSCTITGTAGNDTLRGTARNDIICGLGGNDTIIGLGGNDTIIAGPGNDRIDGGAGNDTIDAGTGTDTIDASNGNDHIDAGSGNDRLLGGAGNDILNGGTGTDAVTPGGGSDTCAPDASDRVDGSCLRDNTGPAIRNVQIPGVIEAGETLTVTWRVTDASGIDTPGVGPDGAVAPNTSAALGGPAGFVTWCGVRLEPSRISGTSTDGVYRATCELPAKAPNGTYTVVLSAADVFGNVIDDYFRYVEFEIRNGSEDRSGPAISDLGALADAYAPGDEVTFTLRASDETGVAGVGVFVMGPNGSLVDDQSQGWITDSSTTLTAGDPTDGAYSVRIRIAETAVTGDYRFLVGAGDVLGNRSWIGLPGFRVVATTTSP